MTAKHAPATPLPWGMDEESQICSGNSVVADARHHSSHPDWRGAYQDQNGGYIVHACNAYPRLVELAELCRLYGAQSNAKDARLIQLANDATDILRELSEGEST